MEVKTINEPDAEPVTLDEIKDACQIDSDYAVRDTELLLYAAAAREVLEKHLNLSLAPKTIEVIWTENRCSVELPYGPVNEIVSVTDFQGNDVDFEAWGSRVVFSNYALYEPIVYPVGYTGNCFYKITYRAGYTQIPSALKLAILLQLNYDLKTAGEDVENLSPNALRKAEPFSKNLIL